MKTLVSYLLSCLASVSIAQTVWWEDYPIYLNSRKVEQLENPNYKITPMAYPDGRIAKGFINNGNTPMEHRVFDAGAAKSVKFHN